MSISPCYTSTRVLTARRIKANGGKLCQIINKKSNAKTMAVYGGMTMRKHNCASSSGVAQVMRIGQPMISR